MRWNSSPFIEPSRSIASIPWRGKRLGFVLLPLTGRWFFGVFEKVKK